MRRVDSLEKTLMLGGIGGKEEEGTTEDEMAAIHGVAKSQTQLSDWTELKEHTISMTLQEHIQFSGNPMSTFLQGNKNITVHGLDKILKVMRRLWKC